MTHRLDLHGEVALITGAASGIGRAVAIELARRKVRAMALVDLGDNVDKVAAEIIRQTPRGSIASPAEIASAVVWLCSGGASFMIGSPLVVDGGYMA